MVSIVTRTTRERGVTFAHVVLENERAQRRRVRLAVLVEDAIWPPRRRALPEPGWDADGVTVTIAGGSRRGIGFATPARVDGSCVELVADDPHAAEKQNGGNDPRVADDDVDNETSRLDDPRGRKPTASSVVQSLGSFAPPLAATPRVPVADTSERATASGRANDTDTETIDGRDEDNRSTVSER